MDDDDNNKSFKFNKIYVFFFRSPEKPRYYLPTHLGTLQYYTINYTFMNI